MALRAAYENLQLDPDDHARVAAFTTFCWHHILEHTTDRWISQVRDYTVRLHHRKWGLTSLQSCSVYHETLDTMVCAFVLDYAELLWPSDSDSRQHLATEKLVRDLKDIYATPANMNITRKKEAEMRACNVTANSRTSTVESMVGCRVRSYFTQLLVSEHPVPEQQPMSASKILRRFLHETSSPTSSGKKRSFASTTDSMADKNLSTYERTSKSPPAHKRRRIDDNAATSTDFSPEHSNGCIRLRFTHSGTRRLQSILFCPARPTAILRKGIRDTGELTDSVSIHPSDGGLSPPQCTSTNGDYQCWLRHCSETFQTAGDVVDHVQQAHPASMEAAFPSVGRAITAFHSRT